MGDIYVVFGNNVFVSSDLNTAQAVYNAIITDEIGQQISVVLDLGENPDYWGCTKKELWTWLDDHPTRNTQ